MKSPPRAVRAERNRHLLAVGAFKQTYKRHAVELTLHGDRTVNTVAKEPGIPAWLLYDWRSYTRPGPVAVGR